MNPLIIIGAGMAGFTVAREFRKLDPTTPILLITADDGGYYAKPMLSNALAQNKSAAQLLNQTMAQMSAQLQCTILPHTRVQALNTTSQTVSTASETFVYSQLVLALGAQPIRLSFGGNAADQLMSVNHLDDYAQFRQRLEHIPGKARVALLGAGLIGCEFADDLAGAGYQVNLVDPNRLPMALLAPPSISQGLQAALVARGVQMHLGTIATEINHHDAALQVCLANGEVLEVDVVLSAVGLQAEIRLAQAAQIKTERGIVLDPYGQTSAPEVYAIGDCAQYTSEQGYSRTLPYIAPIMAAGRALAKTLTGTPTIIDIKPAPVIVKTPSYPIALVAPAANTLGKWEDEMQGAAQVSRFYASNGRMAGFALAPQESGLRQNLLAQLQQQSQ
jgi:rubredoxin---NAD+ reductase